jgi:hypothetical protein
MCQWADVAAELGEVDAGMVLYRKLAPWKHLFATAGPLPVHGVSLALGRLATLRGAVQAADGHFAEAMRVHEVVGSPFGTAETALYWARLLLDRDRQRARTLLTTAADLAGRYGFGDIQLGAREALRAG